MPFQRLLQALVDATPGARGAIFCDQQGEHVELALAREAPGGVAPLTPFDMKICGAHLAAPLVALFEAPGKPGETLQMRWLCEGGTLLCHLLPGRYYVALLVTKGGRNARAAHLLGECARLVALAI